MKYDDCKVGDAVFSLIPAHWNMEEFGHVGVIHKKLLNDAVEVFFRAISKITPYHVSNLASVDEYNYKVDFVEKIIDRIKK